MSYVGYAKIPVDADNVSLRQLINQYSQAGDFFFLRSLHQVSGIVPNLPEPMSPEGQLFNTRFELRWKKQRQSYELLWLGQIPPTTVGQSQDTPFTAIKRQWETEDRPALLHNRKTPQYPNLFRYPTGLDNRIGQRYFRDVATDIVHFVALTVHPSEHSPTNPN